MNRIARLTAALLVSRRCRLAALAAPDLRRRQHPHLPELLVQPLLACRSSSPSSTRRPAPPTLDKEAKTTACRPVAIIGYHHRHELGEHRPTEDRSTTIHPGK